MMTTMVRAANADGDDGSSADDDVMRAMVRPDGHGDAARRDGAMGMYGDGSGYVQRQ